MPGAAPDDPAAYRGVRYQMGGAPYAVGPSGVDRPVQGAPWLRGYPASGSPGEGANGPWFGHQLMRDGRRLMLWFYRLVDPPTQPTDSSAGSVPSRRAVLDVVAVSGLIGVGCGPDTVRIDGDNGWRLNRTTGRIEPIDPTTPPVTTDRGGTSAAVRW